MRMKTKMTTNGQKRRINDKHSSSRKMKIRRRRKRIDSSPLQEIRDRRVVMRKSTMAENLKADLRRRKRRRREVQRMEREERNRSESS